MFVLGLQQVWWAKKKWTIFFLCRLLFILNVIFLIKRNNKLNYVIFSYFLYNTNPNHNFNHTYHAMIFDKIKSNHNFNQTHILYEPTITKMIFSNHNHVCVWLRLFFKVFFTQKCIEIIFFYFFKIIFDINVSK